MNLFEEHLMLNVPQHGLARKVSSDTLPDVIKAMRDTLTDYMILNILAAGEYHFTNRRTLSADAYYILDCVPKEYLRNNMIPAIKLLRKIFNCSLADGKKAIEEYLA